MLFLIILFLPLFDCSYIHSLGHIKCSIPQYYAHSDIHLYPKFYFGACDQIKYQVFCRMPFAEYYIKHCKLNTHKCRCEKAFKEMIKNKTPMYGKDTKFNVNIYDDNLIDDSTVLESDISSKDYFYGDY